jgi:hypothetical protein
MSVDEARRLLLHDAARAALGADAALVLMEMLPPSGWGDVATRQQLEALEQRFELRLDARLADAQRRMIQWNVSTMIALAAVITAIVRFS